MEAFSFNQENNHLYENLPLETKFKLSLIFSALDSASKEQLLNYTKNLIVMYESRLQMLIELHKTL